VRGSAGNCWACSGRALCGAEPWLQAGKYISALVGGLPKRNGWTIAEHAGDRAPDRTQRLLNRAAWDTFAAMGVVRRFAVAGLDEAARRPGRRGGLVIGALDETGQEKAGAATAGVQRQYLGCAGKVANGINTVHLAYVREYVGHALIGARQWIPAAQIDDPVASLVMGLPLDLAFRTKGQLAIDIATEALADGIAFDFFCGDEVYGSCTELREFFEARGQAYVLRVPRNFRVTLPSGKRLTARTPSASCWPASTLRSAPPGRAPRDSAGMPGRGWPPLPAAPLADPPPPQDRRAGLSLLLRA
jgi:DDE superfamily endonuclease